MGHFFLAVMFLRLFFLYRSVLNYSLYTDAYCKKLCSQNGFPNSMVFALKCLLATNPAFVTLLNFCLFTMIYSYLLRIFELPLLKHLDDNFYTLD